MTALQSTTEDRWLAAFVTRQAIAQPIDGDALFREQVGETIRRVTEQRQEQMLRFDLTGAQSVGRIDGEDHGVPELRRPKRFGQLLLVDPFELSVARVRQIVAGVHIRLKNRQGLLSQYV